MYYRYLAGLPCEAPSFSQIPIRLVMALIHLACSYASCQRRLLAATASQSDRTKGNADVLDQSALYSAASLQVISATPLRASASHSRRYEEQPFSGRTGVYYCSQAPTAAARSLSTSSTLCNASLTSASSSKLRFSCSRPYLTCCNSTLPPWP
jgi:hypothetical protein